MHCVGSWHYLLPFIFIYLVLTGALSSVCVHGCVSKSAICISNIHNSKNIDKGSTKLKDAEQHLTSSRKSKIKIL